MKIAVYTIALNEAAHAERWASSAVDADYRIVADTGSTDDTVERLTGRASRYIGSPFDPGVSTMRGTPPWR